MLDDKLKKIIEDKGFKNFWSMFHTLQHNWGYASIDAFGVCLKYFNDSEIWRDVAFVNGKRIEVPSYHGFADPIDNIPRTSYMVNNNVHVELVIGIINEETEHLRGLFNYYLKSKIDGRLRLNNGEITEIENLCKETYHFVDLPHIIMDYLNHTAKLYFGREIEDLDNHSKIADLMRDELRINRNY